jgi:ABC-type bacteriocin/lantibiotic exporter with double-glycine peptidase domain
VTRRTLLIDGVIAAILTVLVVVLSPGLAVVGLIAILVIIVCGVSFALDSRRRRRSSRSRPRRASSRPRTQSRRARPEPSRRPRSRPPR